MALRGESSISFRHRFDLQPVEFSVRSRRGKIYTQGQLYADPKLRIWQMESELLTKVNLAGFYIKKVGYIEHDSGCLLMYSKEDAFQARPISSITDLRLELKLRSKDLGLLEQSLPAGASIFAEGCSSSLPFKCEIRYGMALYIRDTLYLDPRAQVPELVAAFQTGQWRNLFKDDKDGFGSVAKDYVFEQLRLEGPSTSQSFFRLMMGAVLHIDVRAVIVDFVNDFHQNL